MNPNDFFISSYGVRMPPIIYGTAWKKDSTAALVEQAISLGFRGIDTACQPKHYNEAGVGDGGHLPETRNRPFRVVSAKQIHAVDRPRPCSSSL